MNTLLDFRASDFLLSPVLTESQTSSPDIAAALRGVDGISASHLKPARVGSRLHSRLGKARQKVRSPAGRRPLAAEVSSGDSSRSASPSSPGSEGAVCAGELHPQPGGESPAFREPTDLLQWVEDSCRDVCGYASPAAAVAPLQHGLHAATVGKAQLQAFRARDSEQESGSNAEQPSPCTSLELAPQRNGSDRQTGSAGKAPQLRQLTHLQAAALTESLATDAPPANSGSCTHMNSAQQGSPPNSAIGNEPVSARQGESRAQQQVELLKGKLAVECKARQAMEIQLTNQQHEADTAHRTLEESYQAKLKELQQQLQQAAARTGVGGSIQERIQSGATQVVLTGEDLEALRTEMRDQEMLLQAYQAENELAVERMKAMKAQHMQDLTAAAEKGQELERELSLLSASSPGEHPQHQRPPATPQAGAGADAARLQELLSLQSQLEATQAAAFLIEQEMRAKVSAAEAQRQEAQDQLKQMEADNAQAHAQLVQQVQALRLEHARQVADMQAKLAWYADNYELLKGNEDLLRQQARTIVQLEQQLLMSSQRLGNSRDAGGRLADLEEENAKIKAQLAHSAATSSDREASLAEVLQQKLQQLQGAMAQREADDEKRQKALRQECEKMRLENTKRASVSKAATARLKETEQQIEEVRSSYRKKVQALELKLKAAEAKAAHIDQCQGAGRPLPKPAKTALHNAATPGPSAAHADTGSKLEQRIRKLEAELARREAELASLQKRLAAADELVNQAAAREQDMGVTLKSLQQSVAELGSANQALRSQLVELHDMRTQAATSKSWEAQVRDLQHKLDAAEATLAAVKQAHAGALAVHQAELQSAREQHGKQLTQAQQLGEQLASAAWQSKLSAAEKAVDELQTRVRGLECSLTDARAGIPWTPKAMEFSALERKIGELEQQQTQREAYWRSLVDEYTAKLSQQGEQMRQKFELALAAKDGQLNVFRRELDGILNAARILHGPQQQLWQ